MKINWKIRLKNKAFWVAMCSAAVGFIYQVMALFDVVPAYDESTVLNVVMMILSVLGALGIIVDPTTTSNGSISDSDRALSYGSMTEETDAMGSGLVEEEPFVEEAPDEEGGQG